MKQIGVWVARGDIFTIERSLNCHWILLNLERQLTPLLRHYIYHRRVRRALPTARACRHDMAFHHY